MFRGLLVWLIIMVVETIHGVLRGLLIVPHTGERMAARIGWPIGAILVLVVSYLTVRWNGIRHSQGLLRLGIVWTILTFAFEIAIGLLRGFGKEQLWAEINPASGGLMIYSLAVMLFAPLLAARLRKIR
jgi:hypothetical protein